MNTTPSAVIDRVKRNLVGLRMPRALEILDVTLRGIERGETTALDALDILLTEELTLRENRRVRMALQMARLSAVKTLAEFAFAFQPSLDKSRSWRWPNCSSSIAPKPSTKSSAQIAKAIFSIPPIQESLPNQRRICRITSGFPRTKAF